MAFFIILSLEMENTEINIMPDNKSEFAYIFFSEQTYILNYKYKNLVGFTKSNVCVIETFFIKVTKQQFFLFPHFYVVYISDA